MAIRLRLGGIGCALAIAALACLSTTVQAAAAADYQVRISATVSESPAQIVLSWPTQTATGFTVYRRVRGTIPYATLASLPGSATGYTDATASVGTVYEYQVAKAGTPSVTSLVTAAIRAPAVDQHGTVVLVVDATMAAPLAGEIARLEDDLVGDGWKVIRHDVPRFHVDQAGWKEAVVAVRTLIIADRAADPQVNSVLLLGHVPVPYSGYLAPDGHGDHHGAWPADAYYGDLDGTWNDSSVNTTAASRSENDNIPGDGKFDPSRHAGVELAVGRIDLARMGLFGLGEVGLLRRHLDRHHAFRHKLIAPPRRGLVDDNFGEFYGEAFASSGWGSFAALVGHANVAAKDFLSTLAADDYLLAYGCGGGSYTSCSGVGTSTQFSGQQAKAVHTLLFGSYFGDWDSQNNFLRAPLAADGYGLTCAWSGRPKWSLQSMAVGDPIGASALAVQNGNTQVHVALMGDPTLRLHAVAPPATAAAVIAGADVAVSWAASPDVGAGAGEGYHVYRGIGRLGPFTRLTGAPLAGLTYTDAAPGAAAYRYLVRAVALETSGTATYLNVSQAAAADALAGGAAATLHLLSPNGGEIVTAGGDLTVRWEGLAGGAVAIELSLDGGATWMEVGAVVQANGAATIRLPALAAGDARIRVRPALGGAGDASDAGFQVNAAGSGVWDGGAGDLQWTSPANWTGDALPSAGQSVQFNAPAAATTVTVAGWQDLGTMRVTTGGSSAWTYTGPGTLSLRGGLITAGSAAVNFLDTLGSFGLALAADQVWDLGGGTVTCTSVPVSGAGRMTKRGAATLVLTGGGTAWSGGVQHERGTISARQPHALGTGLLTFGTDAGTALTAEFTYASSGNNGDGGVVPTPIRCDNGRTSANLNVLSLPGWAGTRTATFSGELSTGAALDPVARFVVDADSNRAGEVSTAQFTGSHAGFDRAGVEFEVRTGTVVLASTAAAVGPGTGYIVGGDATRRHAALMLGAATTLDRPIAIGAASAHADTWGAPAIGTRASGMGMLTGPITLPASGAPALHLLAHGGASSALYVSGAIADGAGSAGVAIGGAVTGAGVVLGSTGTATPGTVVLGAPCGSSYDGGTIVCATLQVGNLAGSATGTGPVELTGSVVGVRATSAGSGYATTSVVTIAAPTGGGSTSPAAAAVATASGGITEMRLVRPGWGYASAPAVTVADGSGAVVQALMSYGRLTGTGVIAGPVAVGANCTVAPGTSGLGLIGCLSTGSVTFAAGSTYTVDLSGSQCDVLAVTGNLDLSAAETLAVSGTPVAGTSYVIASWTGTRSGSFDTVTGLPGGWSVHADDAGKRLVIAQAAPVAGSAPEAHVYSMAGPVADGGTSPLTGLLPGVASSATWMVSNLGTAPLTLGAPVLAGQSNCTAVLASAPPATLAPGGLAGLAITITPAAGPWSFTVSIPTNDADENPYDWTVSGTAVAAPEIELRRGARVIAAGGSDLGNLAVAGSALPLTYQVANLGSASLALTLPIAISGQVNCTAVVQTAPAASVAAGDSSPCVLAVTPLAAGAWSLTAFLTSNDIDEHSTVWTVSGTATGTPEIDVQRLAPVASGGTDAVGAVTLGAGRTLSYTVANLGTAALPVGGPVVLSSTANCAATIDLAPAALIAAGGSGALQVTVTPAAAGPWSFVLAMGNGDADEGTYQWTVSGSAVPPLPEIAVSRGTAIADGGSDSLAGTVAGVPATASWTIANLGGSPLTVAAPGPIAGSNCTVAVVAAPASPVASASSAALVLQVTPLAAGPWSFPVSLVNDDADESPYDWTVSGTAVPHEPEIGLSRGAATVASGGSESVAGSVQGVATVLSWTIANSGNATLTVGDPGTILGSNCSVAVDSAPSATVAAGASTVLAVRVTPLVAGAWSFPVSLVTNDADENPFAWTVSGSTAPEIAVSRGGLAVADGGGETVAGTVQGAATLLSWTIANAGSATLAVAGPGPVAGSNCTVAVETVPDAAVGPGGGTVLALRVTPTATGAWSFPLSLATDDADENPFDWTVSGSASAPPAPEIAVLRGADLANGAVDTVVASERGTPQVLDWTIRNLGNLPLSVLAPATIAGSGCTVTVVQIPASSLLAGGATTLSVSLTPDVAGPWSFTVSLDTNDADENPFVWTVAGTAAEPVFPEVEISRAGPLANGATDAIGGSVASQSLTLVYTLANAGTATLTLGGPGVVASTNCLTTLVTAPAAGVAPGASTTLVLTVVPQAEGDWSCSLSLASNDADENPCAWTVAGRAAAAATGTGGGVVAAQPAVPQPERTAGPIGVGSIGSSDKGCGLGGIGLVLAAAGWFAGARRRRR